MKIDLYFTFLSSVLIADFHVSFNVVRIGWHTKYF